MFCATRLYPAAGNLCLENINDAMTLVDITHETHVSSTATVRISTDLKPEDSAAFFGIKVRSFAVAWCCAELVQLQLLETRLPSPLGHPFSRTLF